MLMPAKPWGFYLERRGRCAIAPYPPSQTLHCTSLGALTRKDTLGIIQRRTNRKMPTTAVEQSMIVSFLAICLNFCKIETHLPPIKFLKSLYAVFQAAEPPFLHCQSSSIVCDTLARSTPDSSSRLFQQTLISLKAGGTGLNLTAADYVIHTDPWWNPAVEDQASDRAHRIGQQRPVTIYRLVAKDTIEDKIVQLHHHKRDLADSLLEGADMSGKISTEALLQLIHG